MAAASAATKGKGKEKETGNESNWNQPNYVATDDEYLLGRRSDEAPAVDVIKALLSIASQPKEPKPDVLVSADIRSAGKGSKFAADFEGLKQMDVYRLAGAEGGHRWITDNIISTYLKMIADRNNIYNRSMYHNIPRVAYLDAGTISQMAGLVEESTEQTNYIIRNMERMGKFNTEDPKNVTFRNCDLIISVFGTAFGKDAANSSHWICCVVDVKKRRIEEYDSFSHIGRQVTWYIKTLVNFLCLNRIGAENGKLTKDDWRYIRMVDPDPEKTWPKILRRQDDMNNCGIFACRYAECRTRFMHLPETLNETNIPDLFNIKGDKESMFLYRRKMLFEIAEMRIDTTCWARIHTPLYFVKWTNEDGEEEETGCRLNAYTPGMFRSMVIQNGMKKFNANIEKNPCTIIDCTKIDVYLMLMMFDFLERFEAFGIPREPIESTHHLLDAPGSNVEGGYVDTYCFSCADRRRANWDKVPLDPDDPEMVVGEYQDMFHGIHFFNDIGMHHAYWYMCYSLAKGVVSNPLQRPYDKFKINEGQTFFSQADSALKQCAKRQGEFSWAVDDAGADNDADEFDESGADNDADEFDEFDEFDDLDYNQRSHFFDDDNEPFDSDNDIK